MKIKAYGIIRKSTNDIRNTTTFKNLSSLSIREEDIVIDVVSPKQYQRPQLEKLIDDLNQCDTIILFSIKSLIDNEPEFALHYYISILEKGIHLIIYDFNGSVAKLSPFSNVVLGNINNGENKYKRNKLSNEELYYSLECYIREYQTDKKLGLLKQSRKRFKLTREFIDIYFAYESYQIDLNTTMQLLQDMCDVKHRLHFELMSLSFETSLDYEQQLLEYATQYPDILETPKRSNSLPKEYFEICDYLNNNESNRRNRVNEIMTDLNMFAGYDVFHRWELKANYKHITPQTKRNCE